MNRLPVLRSLEGVQHGFVPGGIQLIGDTAARPGVAAEIATVFGGSIEISGCVSYDACHRETAIRTVLKAIENSLTRSVQFEDRPAPCSAVSGRLAVQVATVYSGTVECAAD